ncbi:hypothetical protein FTO70_08840 [Methanosarcina sp. KYL-1]|uniref:hypothetical protein n=1 Tax=Methanosarcina sp. KYL-1 TaxID=2602068 RepID=UPI002101B826|nr:hypothetical protein [Methanosarcina sp. KYL-1]MCQ1535780.1 hypothetical protein [Methanosarcina sp. KYL-1]
MVSMLDLLDLNMRLINSTVGDRVSDYPFLAPTLKDTGRSSESMDSTSLPGLGTAAPDQNRLHKRTPKRQPGTAERKSRIPAADDGRRKLEVDAESDSEYKKT